MLAANLLYSMNFLRERELHTVLQGKRAIFLILSLNGCEDGSV